MRTIVSAICLGLFFIVSQASQAEEISLRILLEEMLNRANVAEYPEPEFICKQASSYNRRSKTPRTPDWFAGADFDQFYGCERTDGRTEWLMLDVEGPGAVTRWWLTQYYGAGTIRIYLDGANEPIFAGTRDELVGGNAITDRPLAANRGGGRNLYLPIPFREHCKITFESPNPDADFAGTSPQFTNHSLFYIIDYLQYPQGTQVKTLTRSDLQANADLIARVGGGLLRPEQNCLPTHRTVQGGKKRLEPGQSMTRTVDGLGAICQLRLRLDAKNIPQALRSTVITADFDGKQRIWAPFGEFFGSGLGVNPYQTWWCRVDKDGWMTCWWPMPFRKPARISVTNFGAVEPVDVELGDIGKGARDGRTDRRIGADRRRTADRGHARSLPGHAADGHAASVHGRPFSERGSRYGRYGAGFLERG